MNSDRSAATLYVILGSDACRTAMLMLEHKGVAYRTVTLATGLYPVGVRLRGFPGNPAPVRTLDGRSHRMLGMADQMGTVPALRIDDQRAQTNHEIARMLERLQPEPPLFPADPDHRREVEDAERWGDDMFQMTARRLALAAVLDGPDAMHYRAGSGRLGSLPWRHELVRSLGTRALGRFVFAADQPNERELLASLPPMLDRIDSWIDAGVLNAQALNVADFMIATSLALLGYRRDLRPELESRPAGRLVERVLPEPAGSLA